MHICISIIEPIIYGDRKSSFTLVPAVIFDRNYDAHDIILIGIEDFYNFSIYLVFIREAMVIVLYKIFNCGRDRDTHELRIGSLYFSISCSNGSKSSSYITNE